MACGRLNVSQTQMRIIRICRIARDHCLLFAGKKSFVVNKRRKTDWRAQACRPAHKRTTALLKLSTAEMEARARHVYLGLAGRMK